MAVPCFAVEPQAGRCAVRMRRVPEHVNASSKRRQQEAAAQAARDERNKRDGKSRGGRIRGLGRVQNARGSKQSRRSARFLRERVFRIEISSIC
eukprot:6195569-Pleurochrysis_carterae.AAC.1